MKSATTGNTYEYRPITISGQTCTIGTTVAKTITSPNVTNLWFMSFVGSGSEMPIYPYSNITTNAPTYTNQFILYSAVDSAISLLTLNNSLFNYDSYKTVHSVRNGVVTVLDKYNSDLEQYTISSDGKSAILTGTFPNIDVNGNSDFGTAKRLMGSGGYYWLFDGPKLIKYAAKPDGGHL
jgi:hypothetical protein